MSASIHHRSETKLWSRKEKNTPAKVTITLLALIYWWSQEVYLFGNKERALQSYIAKIQYLKSSILAKLLTESLFAVHKSETLSWMLWLCILSKTYQSVYVRFGLVWSSYVLQKLTWLIWHLKMFIFVLSFDSPEYYFDMTRLIFISEHMIQPLYNMVC